MSFLGRKFEFGALELEGGGFRTGEIPPLFSQLVSEKIERAQGAPPR